MPTVRQILDLISEVADKNNLSQPWIVGGIPRDKVTGFEDDINDIDLTTGDDTTFELAEKSNEAMANMDVHFKTFPDGHSQISVDGIKIDFSSFFIHPSTKPLLKMGGLENPSSMMLELFSRDFTCNTLLMDLNFSSIKDVTGLSMTDIRRKMIRTPLPAKVTLAKEKRIPRVFYFAAKLGFDVDKEIIDFIKANKDLLKKLKPKYFEEKMQGAASYDLTRTVSLINEMDLWDYIPSIPEFLEFRK